MQNILDLLAYALRFHFSSWDNEQFILILAIGNTAFNHRNDYFYNVHIWLTKKIRKTQNSGFK